MGLFRKIVRLTPFHNATTKGMGSRYLRDAARQTTDIAKTLFTVTRSSYSESFEDAMQRLQLNPDDLAEREKAFYRLALFFLVCALVIVGYGVYLAWFGSLTSLFMCIGVAFYSFAMAFRYHFWWFQVKNRKLGCTFKEWFRDRVE